MNVFSTVIFKLSYDPFKLSYDPLKISYDPFKLISSLDIYIDITRLLLFHNLCRLSILYVEISFFVADVTPSYCGSFRALFVVLTFAIIIVTGVDLHSSSFPVPIPVTASTRTRCSPRV